MHHGDASDDPHRPQGSGKASMGELASQIVTNIPLSCYYYYFYLLESILSTNIFPLVPIY